METNLVYFDETGDDGLIKTSSDIFILTGIYMSSLIEDIMEKDSKESYFIQICDFISYFVHLYYKCCVKKNDLPNRVANLIDKKFIGSAMATLLIKVLKFQQKF